MFKTWTSLKGHLRKRPRRLQHEPQEGPRRSHVGGKMDPRALQDAPRAFQERAKSVPRGPKSAPRWAKTAPRCAKSVPRGSKRGPRWAQDGPKNSRIVRSLRLEAKCCAARRILSSAGFQESTNLQPTAPAKTPKGSAKSSPKQTQKHQK